MDRHVLLLVLAVSACSSARADDPGGNPVLAKYCAKCHGVKSEGDFGFAADTKRLVAEGYVVPGDAAKSLVYRRIADGEMPPAGVKARPSKAELEAVRAWIDNMTTAAPAVFRRDRDIARVLAADEARLAYDARGFARYFTLTHLANAGVPEAQLERYRVALAALLASLTWSADAPAVVAVDAERTLYRVDLRALGWTTAQWDALRASYPYGVARGPRVPDAVRADWFVATASRPPLYHTLLALPDSEAELARRLGVDLADDVAHGRAARAGFNRSGVSVNNRVIERHATRHGALWRSFDFASSIGNENVFAHPLAFVPSGGELIFNLPDGMQAYMLVDGNGRRIDKAPTKIVSDPRRPDRAVEVGVSCIGCHASGIVPKADQIRALAARFDREDRIAIDRLYPPANVLAAFYDADRARFATAYTALHAKPAADAGDEPITLMVARYEAELDARLAAAELGLTADELIARVGRAYDLPLDALAHDGGTIKRDTWAQLFPRIVDELGVGVAFTPHGSFDSPPAVWIDHRRATWRFAAAQVDQPAARAACGTGWDLPRQDELVAAVGGGLGSALQLHRPLWTGAIKLDAQNLRYAAVVDSTATARRADVTDRFDAVCVKRGTP